MNRILIERICFSHQIARSTFLNKSSEAKDKSSQGDKVFLSFSSLFYSSSQCETAKLPQDESRNKRVNGLMMINRKIYDNQNNKNIIFKPSQNQVRVIFANFLHLNRES